MEVFNIVKSFLNILGYFALSYFIFIYTSLRPGVIGPRSARLSIRALFCRVSLDLVLGLAGARAQAAVLSFLMMSLLVLSTVAHWENCLDPPTHSY